jgi:hypothetical protein
MTKSVEQCKEKGQLEVHGGAAELDDGASPPGGVRGL